MQFVNIDSRVFYQPEFTDASLEQVGLWIKLYAYCSREENSGIITLAGSWSESHCQRLLGCSKANLMAPCPLWHIRGAGVLNLYHYNLQAEEFSRQRRRTARHAGQVGGQSQSGQKQAAAKKNGRKGGAPRKIIPLIQGKNPT